MQKISSYFGRMIVIKSRFIVKSRFILVTLLAIGCVAFEACGSGNRPLGLTPPGGGSTGSPVFVSNTNASSVSAYLLNPSSGALQTVTNSPFSTGRSSPVPMALDPAGKFLLVANSAASSTTVFSVNSTTAVLTPVTGSPFTASANEIRLVMHPSGRFVYALSSSPAQIDGYSFDPATGALAALSGFPVTLNSTGELGLAISPNGAFLYTANPNTNRISSFSIASTGALTALTTASATNGSPDYLTFDTSGSFLFAVNVVGGILGGGSVSVFNVSLTGGLTEVSGSPFPVGSTPVIAVFSNGALYVVNQTSGTLSAFALSNTTGRLTALNGSPYQLGTSPTGVAAAMKGAFLIVTNSSSANLGSISVFAVANDGTLISVAGSPFTPDTATPGQVVAF